MENHNTFIGECVEGRESQNNFTKLRFQWPHLHGNANYYVIIMYKLITISVLLTFCDALRQSLLSCFVV